MTGLVFDDSGRAWSGNSAAFAQAFAATASHDGPAEYALHTLGFAAIDIFGRSAQIRFTPARVHDNAIDAAFKWLAQRSFRRIALAQFDGTWRYFAAKSLDTAIACAVTAINDAPKTRVPDLMQRAQPLSQLSHNSPMHGLLAEWKAALAGQPGFDPVAAARRHLGDRFVIVGADRDRASLAFQSIGRGFHNYGRDWPDLAKGLPIHMQPDRRYGAWVTESYGPALRDQTPRIHDVDAMITNAAGTRARMRIKRIILPVIMPGKAPQIIGGSILDDHIDLRQEALDAQTPPAETKPREIPSFSRPAHPAHSALLI